MWQKSPSEFLQGFRSVMLVARNDGAFVPNMLETIKLKAQSHGGSSKRQGQLSGWQLEDYRSMGQQTTWAMGIVS